MAEFRYRHSGLTIASVLELPEWAAFAEDARSPADVTIALSQTLDRRDAGFDGTAFRFHIDGLGSWAVDGGRRITLAPGLAAAPPELRLFTLGSAWAALGYQRGHAVWHGSAVARGGRAILLSGDAGAGKSTLAAALVARGATLVSDDLARVEPGNGASLIHPSSTRLKLWGEAVDAFGWRGRVLQRDWLREDKFHCAVPENAAGGSVLPLAALVVLGEGETETLDALRGGEAVQALLAATTYRPEMLEAMGLWPQQVTHAARIAAQTPVVRLTRPKDFARLDAVCERIEAILPH